jgi:hypothetical protein
MQHYRICGFDVAAEFALPGVTDAPPTDRPPDVIVRRAPVPMDLAAASARGPNWALDGRHFLLRVPGVARFQVVDGNEIAMQVEPGVDENDALVFLLGSAFGVLLHQRGRMVLHASAVDVGETAVLFCGVSGAGKSTLAAALCAKGYAHANDDVCVVGFDGDGRPVMTPDGRMLKLWGDSLDYLGLADRKQAPVRADFEKYYVEPPGRARQTARPIGAVYMLQEEQTALTGGIERLNAVDAAVLLRHNAYRPYLVQKMGLSGRFFAAASSLQRRVGIFSLTRPFDLAAMPRVIARLEAHWQALSLQQGRA